jgi:ureidoacrylate peracid hydrolase
VTYELNLTGLLIVDPYNDFLSEGGKLYEQCRETIEALDTVQHMREVLAAARDGGYQVFFVPHHRWRERSYSDWKYIAPSQRQADELKIFQDGSWGGTFHPDFQPRDGEVVAHEHWLSSGFANTDLDLQLKKHGLHKVVVIGLHANTCIESTVRFAAELGYDVTLVNDAIAGYSMEQINASLQFNLPNYANTIASTHDVVAQLRAH